MLAWSEGTDNGRQKTRNHGYDVIVGGELLLIARSPRKLVAKPKTQINRRRTLPSFPLMGCLPQAARPEEPLRRSGQQWHCSQIKGGQRFTL